MAEITLPSMYIPKKPDESGNLNITLKTEDGEKTKKRKDKESERLAIDEIWDKAKESDVDDKVVIFEKVIDNPKTSADMSFFRREPLRTFIDQDMRVWLSLRAEGGFTYKATICNTNGKYLREHPPKFYHFDRDGDTYLEEQDDRELKHGFKGDKKRRGFIDESLLNGGNDTIEPQEILRTVSDAMNKGVEIARANKDEGNSNKEMMDMAIKIAEIVKGNEIKSDNSSLISSLVSNIPIILEKLKPVEKNDDKIYTMMIEMQKSNNDMLREIQRGNSESIGKLSDMITKSNETFSKEISKTKEDMVALINTRNNPAFNIAEIITPILETNKLTNALQMQAFGGLTQMLKMVVEMKDLGKHENEDVEEKPMATVIMDSVTKLMVSGMECFKAMKSGELHQLNQNQVSSQQVVDDGEKINDVEIAETVDINEIIEIIIAGAEEKKSPVAITETVFKEYEDQKQELINILNQSPEQLMAKVSGENLMKLNTHVAIVNQVVEEIKKKLGE